MRIYDPGLCFYSRSRNFDIRKVMSREQTYTSIILKKTPYGEADEIITGLTLEAGKVRFLAKSVKLAKSKLQNSLQALFLCRLRAAWPRPGQLHKIIGVEPVEVFPNLRQDLLAVKAAYGAAELVLRFLPDEQKSEGAYKLSRIFLEFLEKNAGQAEKIQAGLLAFKIKLLEILGLGITLPAQPIAKSLVFEPFKGGFAESPDFTAAAVSPKAAEDFLALRAASFLDLPKKLSAFEELKPLVDGFLEYQLERELKAEKSLDNVV